MLSKGVRPQNPAQHLRGSSRRCSGAGQDRGVQAIMPRQETCRDAVCAFEAYPTARPAAIARAMRCPVRVHVGSDCAEPSQACQVGRPATTTRPCVLCVTLQASVKSSVSRPAQSSGWQRTASTNGISRPAPSVCRLLQQNLPIGDIDFDYSIIGTGEVCFHPLPSSFLTIVLPLVHALMITHADLGAAKAQGLCVDNGGLSRLNTRSWT